MAEIMTEAILAAMAPVEAREVAIAECNGGYGGGHGQGGFIGGQGGGYGRGHGGEQNNKQGSYYTSVPNRSAGTFNDFE